MLPRPAHDLPPPRPHHRLTDDGRPLREVLSYTRRSARFTPRQAEGWSAHHEDWYVPEESVDAPDFTWAEWFGRDAPMIVEIGSGIGEATAALAASRPDHDVLAFEVWMPGIADTLGRLGEAGVTNVRLCSVDAAWSLEHLVGASSLQEVWTFFPDPWHKTKHHKRRLVDPAFAALVASRLVPGGVWRLATDWAPYADQMIEAVRTEPDLDGGPVGRWEERPLTRFERKGREAGRSITDLCYRRTEA